MAQTRSLTKLPPWAGHFLAVVLVAIATTARILVVRSFGPLPLFITYYPAMILSALFGGVGPGLTATVLTCLLTDLLFLEPEGWTLKITHTNDIIAMAIFFSCGFLISLITGWLHKARTAEEATRQSEERFRTLADNMAQLAWMADGEGKVFWCNKRWHEYTGNCSGETGDGLDWQDIMHPDHKTLRMERMRNGLAGGQPWEDTVLLRRHDGEYRSFLCTAIPIMDPEGNIWRWFATYTDITEQRKSEESLREAQVRMHQAMQIGRSFEFEWNTVTDEVTRGIECTDILGITQDPTHDRGQECFQRVHRDDRDRFTKTLEALSPQQDTYNIIYRFIKPSGDTAILNETARGFFDEEGKLVRLIGMTADVTEKEQALKELRESEQLYRAIGESINFGVWVCTPDGRNIYASGSFLKMVGLTQEQCSDFGWGSVLHPDDVENTMAAWKQCAETGETWDKEHRFKGVDGQWHAVLARGVPARNDKGEIIYWAGINLDIDNLKKAEEQLRQQSEALEAARLEADNGRRRLEAIMETLPVGMAITDANGGTIKSNKAFESIWGAPRPQTASVDDYAVYKAWWADTAKPVAPHEWASAKAIIGNESVVGQLMEIERFDGSHAFVINSASPICDTEGKITGSAVAIQDISDLRRTQIALQRIGQRFELLALTAGELLYSTKPQKIINGLCESVMRHLDCQAFFNFLADETTGRLHLNACGGIPEEEAKKIEWLDYGVAVCGCAARDGNRIVAEHIPTTPDERTDLVKSYGIKAYACHPILGPAGKVMGTLSFGTKNREVFSEDDLSMMKAVTDQVATAMIRVSHEEALKKAYDELEKRVRERTAELRRQADLLDLSHDAIFVRDNSGVIIFWNAGAEFLYGFSREDTIGAVSNDLLQTEFPEPIESIIAQVLQKGQWEGELRQKKKDGGKITVASRWALQHSEEGQSAAFMETNRDITTQRFLEDQLRQSQKMQAIGTLAGGVAHDFNNLLAGIIGFTELVLDDTPKNSPVEANLQRILKAGYRGRDLVNQILTFSRQTKTGKTPVTVTPLIKETLKLLRATVPATIQISLDLQSDAVIMADVSEFQQVFMNLCTNAFFAMREKGGTLGVSVQEIPPGETEFLGDSNMARDGLLKMVVSDTGHGINKEIQERIFDPFFTTKEPGQGTGLGLSVVYGIVKALGGVIDVESEPGKGAVFTVYLPLYKKNTDQTEAAAG